MVVDSVRRALVALKKPWQENKKYVPEAHLMWSCSKRSVSPPVFGYHGCVQADRVPRPFVRIGSSVAFQGEGGLVQRRAINLRSPMEVDRWLYFEGHHGASTLKRSGWVERHYISQQRAHLPNHNSILRKVYPGQKRKIHQSRGHGISAGVQEDPTHVHVWFDPALSPRSASSIPHPTWWEKNHEVW